MNSVLKEIKEHSFYEDNLGENIIVIDLGACRGEFINEMEKNYNIQKAILIEANPSNFKLLPKKENYILYNNVISNIDDQAVKFMEDLNSPYNGSTIFNYFNGIEHTISTISLEKIIKENNIEFIDILKIDIEGSEYNLLENLKEEVFDKIGQITVEFHDFIDVNLKTRTKNLINRIENFGFKSVSKPISYMFNSEHYDVLFHR